MQRRFCLLRKLFPGDQISIDKNRLQLQLMFELKFAQACEPLPMSISDFAYFYVLIMILMRL
jgi:hypothetical protein